MPGAVKICNIPYGFFEKEMLKYFSQFGRVEKVKLFRSRKTGNSKGFAFVQFGYEKVAKIVSETMNNYLMFDKILKCQFIPASKIQKSMFKACHRTMIPKLGEERHTTKVNSFKDENQEAAARLRLFKKLKKRNLECRRLGINYQFKIPALPDNISSLSRRRPIKREVKIEKSESVMDGSTVDSTANPSSLYSFVVDSDDDIEFTTPPQAVKKRKLSKDEKPAIEVIHDPAKEEPLSDDGEGEKKALKQAAAMSAKLLGKSKRTSKEKRLKKKMKKQKSSEGDIDKVAPE